MMNPICSKPLTNSELEAICSAIFKETQAPFNLFEGEDFGHVQQMISAGLTLQALYDYADDGDKKIIRRVVNSQVFGIEEPEQKETHTIELPAIEDVQFTVIAEQEDTPVRGNAMASGDGKVDRKAEDSIIRSLNGGNVWAWATVEVRATYRGLVASEYLGCCSYKSEEDFEKDAYYASMKATAYADLIAQLKAL